MNILGPTKKGRAASVANAVVKQVAARRPGGEVGTVL